jgi:Flp pilus assembly protein TadG
VISKVTRRTGQRGYTLIGMTISAIPLLGVLGMAVDIGRLYIAKNETQIFTDAAALSAATKLNGTSQGITDANAAVAASVNTWNLNSTTTSGYTTEFATSSTGPWVTNPGTPTGYTYVRVALPVTLPMYFIPMVVANPGCRFIFCSRTNVDQFILDRILPVFVGEHQHHRTEIRTVGRGIILDSVATVQWRKKWLRCWQSGQVL